MNFPFKNQDNGRKGLTHGRENKTPLEFVLLPKMRQVDKSSAKNVQKENMKTSTGKIKLARECAYKRERERERTRERENGKTERKRRKVMKVRVSVGRREQTYARF